MQKQDEQIHLVKPEHVLTEEQENSKHSATKTRKDLQIPRRLFHMASGVAVGAIYASLLTHQSAVSILGTCFCVLYIFERVRLSYPELAEKIAPISKYLLRAEEQLEESSSIPMLIGLMLTLITFPKVIALVAIYTLALADPASAMVGIKWGRTHIVKEKSVEGSLAFFLVTFLVTLITFLTITDGITGKVWLLAFFTSIGVSAFEMIPLRLDDNLTIPIATAFWCWTLTALFGIAV